MDKKLYIYILYYNIINNLIEKYKQPSIKLHKVTFNQISPIEVYNIMVNMKGGVIEYLGVINVNTDPELFRKIEKYKQLTEGYYV